MYKISVIITCFNLERFISSAIESVFQQDFKDSVEIIVVDDFSSDNSIGAIDLCIQESPTNRSLRLIRHTKNSGVMCAMITGLEFACGEFIFFLDGDDFWERTKLSASLRHFANGIDFVSHGIIYIDENDREINRLRDVAFCSGTSLKYYTSEEIREGLLFHRGFIWLGSAFSLRRSKAGIDEFIKFCSQRKYINQCYQDWPLAVWVACSNEFSFVVDERKLLRYRLHDENYSSSSRTQEKFVRNLTKSISTMNLIEEIQEFHAMNSDVIRNSSIIKRYYEMELKIFTVSRIGALIFLFKCQFEELYSGRGRKLLIKVIFIIVFGQAFYFWLKNSKFALLTR